MCFYIVSKGVKNGIEKLNVWMMPSLFILLILMLVYAISKDGFMMAVKFLCLIFPKSTLQMFLKL